MPQSPEPVRTAPARAPPETYPLDWGGGNQRATFIRPERPARAGSTLFAEPDLAALPASLPGALTDEPPLSARLRLSIRRSVDDAGRPTVNRPPEPEQR